MDNKKLVQSLTDAVGSVLVMGNSIRGEVEAVLRAALAEAAVRSQFKPGERGQVVEIAAQVTVMGEPVAEAYVYEDVDGDDILGLRLLKEDYPMQHGEKLYIEPTTSITQAETHAIELRAYEATVQNLEQRIRELEALMVPGRFPSDVMTAAGLVYHGKRDKVLAERLRIGAQSMLAAAAPAPKEGE